MEFNKHNIADYDLLLHNDYLVRYHAGQRILHAYNISLGISEIRTVFPFLSKDLQKSENKVVINEGYELARENLFLFIKKYLFLSIYENITKKELNECLLDECYVDKPRVEIVKKLVTLGADIYAKDDWDWPAYIRALQQLSSTELLHFFLDKGIDVNWSYPPYVNAPTNYHVTFWTKALSSYLEDETIQALIEKGANLKEIDHNGNNCLHLAAKSKVKPETLQQFFEAGIDINAANVNGETPLMLVCENPNSTAFLQALLERGANPNIKNTQGKTAIQRLAQSYSGANMVRLLAQYGAALDEKNDIGQTPLIIAVEQNNLGSLKVLLEFGANKNITDAKGEKPYDIAIAKGFMEIAALFSADAEKDYKARPEYWQIQELKNEIIKALKAGKKSYHSDKEGWSELAFKEGQYILEGGAASTYTKTYKEEDALKYLYDSNSYLERQHSAELQLWKLTLSRLA